MKIGIDIGGMSVKLGIVNDDNVITHTHVIKTNTQVSATEFINEIIEAVSDLLSIASLNIQNIEKIGLGIPGTIDVENGIILYSNNLDWHNIEVVKQFKQHFSQPIAIANDADSAALGEVCAGAAVGYDNAILLTLGTGVGSGIIMNKKVFTGSIKGGCELGHIIVDINGNQCTCGNVGCLEAHASASALIAMAQEAAKNNPETSMLIAANQDINCITGKMVFDEAQNNDMAALSVVEEYLRYLSVGVANVINAYRPQLIILGGGVANQKEKLTSQISARVKNLVFGGAVGEIAEITTSKLGNDAGIIGAANL